MNDFINAYINWLKSKISLKDINGYYEITTPFLDRHNDHVQIYVQNKKDKLILSDDGYVISDLIMSGIDLSLPRRQAVLTTILNRFGVQIEDDVIFVEATLDTFPQKKHQLIQAMLSVDDMFLTSQPRAISFFLEDVEQFLIENQITYFSDFQLVGKSGFAHSFDFAIPAPHNKADRLIKTVNNPTRERTESIIFAWDDTKDARKKDSEMFVILNDKEKEIRSDILSAFHQYKITPIKWDLRYQYISQLAV